MQKPSNIKEIKKTQINAYAKINYSINIKGLIESGEYKGYHDVELIMQTIPLCDYITIWTENRKDLSDSNPDSIDFDIKMDKFSLPLEKNIAYKAAVSVINYIKNSDDHSKNSINNLSSIHINIEKHIPVGGGLGGSSADAAGVISGLNSHLALNLSITEMKQIGAKLGADIPFLIEGGMALATGIGEQVRPLPPIKNGFVVVATPRFEMSTKEVYNKYDDIRRGGYVNGGYIKTIEGVNMFDKDGKRIIDDVNTSELTKETSLLVSELESGNIANFYQNVFNVLEIPAFDLDPRISVLKNELKKTNPLCVLMSGSGASVYAIYSKLSDARRAISDVSNEIEVLMSRDGLKRGLDCEYTICDISRLH